ncbi:MAG: hypothetical protein LBB26_04615 [Puniceicoccales bacterium]|nr:hypothetical protein [Puniceicoccales bacterium]
MLRWSAVDSGDDFISVKTVKTGAQVEIPIWSLLQCVLRKAANSAENFSGKGSARDGYVFPAQAEMYLHNPDGITLHVKKVLAKAGILGVTYNSTQPAACEKVVKRQLRKASDYDFHSFLVTWITIALAQGLPMEILQRVTGHSTASVGTKHCFQPNCEDFRRVLENKLPSALRCDGNISTIFPPSKNGTSFAVEKLRSMDRENWEGPRDEIFKFYETNKL